MKCVMVLQLYEQWGDILDYGNHRGIKLIEYLLKVWERISRRRPKIDIDKVQYAFMKGVRGKWEIVPS